MDQADELYDYRTVFSSQAAQTLPVTSQAVQTCFRTRSCTTYAAGAE